VAVAPGQPPAGAEAGTVAGNVAGTVAVAPGPPPAVPEAVGPGPPPAGDDADAVPLGVAVAFGVAVLDGDPLVAGVVPDIVGDGEADAVGEADVGAGTPVLDIVAGHVVMPMVGFPGPGVEGAAGWRKQAATATPLASVVVETSFRRPNEPQFKFVNDCCNRAAMNVNRVFPVPGAGLGARIRRLTSCCSRLG